MGEFVDYLKMTPGQQAQVREHLVTKNLTVESLPQWRFYVRNDGAVTRQKGCHKPTEATEAQWSRERSEFFRAPAPSKDQPVRFTSGGKFSIGNGR